eukprot:1673647-Pleurochrysis_carterae.AAC.1
MSERSGSHPSKPARTTHLRPSRGVSAVRHASCISVVIARAPPSAPWLPTNTNGGSRSVRGANARSAAPASHAPPSHSLWFSRARTPRAMESPLGAATSHVAGSEDNVNSASSSASSCCSFGCARSWSRLACALCHSAGGFGGASGARSHTPTSACARASA